MLILPLRVIFPDLRVDALLYFSRDEGIDLRAI
jgi:hypothetical protein